MTEDRVVELERKLDLEVAASRGNAKLANDEMGKRLAAEATLKLEQRRRIAAEEKLYGLAKSFVDLHNVARDVVSEVEHRKSYPGVLARLSLDDRTALGL